MLQPPTNYSYKIYEMPGSTPRHVVCVRDMFVERPQAVLQHFVEQLAMCTADLENLQSRQGRKRTERNGAWGRQEGSTPRNKRGPKQNITKKTR